MHLLLHYSNLNLEVSSHSCSYCFVSVTTFCNWLQQVFADNHIDVVLGDFKIDAFDKGKRLSNVLVSCN